MFENKKIEFSSEKSALLKAERGVSFEQIVPFLTREYILDLSDHPNRAKYPGQRICVLDIEGYAYIIPFVEDKTKIFLKTIIPSRKATAQYLKANRSENEKF